MPPLPSLSVRVWSAAAPSAAPTASLASSGRGLPGAQPLCAGGTCGVEGAGGGGATGPGLALGTGAATTGLATGGWVVTPAGRLPAPALAVLPGCVLGEGFPKVPGPVLCPVARPWVAAGLVLAGAVGLGAVLADGLSLGVATGEALAATGVPPDDASR
ncbi:hypothetical protein [Kitasatospora sp. NPDC001132]